MLEYHHSKRSVSVYLKKINQSLKVTGQILDALAKADGLMSEW